MFEINPVVAAMIGAQEGERFRRRQEASSAAEWQAYAGQLQDHLAICEAQKAAAIAMLIEYKRLHPNSEMHQPTSLIYKRGQYSGKQKSKGTLIWEQAFDAKLTEMGIADPSARRDD